MVTIWCAAVIEESGSVLASFLNIFGCQLDPERRLFFFLFFSFLFFFLSKETSGIHTGNGILSHCFLNVLPKPWIWQSGTQF